MHGSIFWTSKTSINSQIHQNLNLCSYCLVFLFHHSRLSMPLYVTNVLFPVSQSSIEYMLESSVNSHYQLNNHSNVNNNSNTVTRSYSVLHSYSATQPVAVCLMSILWYACTISEHLTLVITFLFSFVAQSNLFWTAH